MDNSVSLVNVYVCYIVIYTLLSLVVLYARP